jgi:predicted AlkP superfamily pyrophosphatase or phosphodiesterase
MNTYSRYLRAILFTLCAVVLACPTSRAQDDSQGSAFNKKTKHVLLLSLDGFHELEMESYIEAHPGSALADLASRSVRYTNATSSRPSDSFPGSMAMVTGGSPASTGIFYDSTWDDNLSAPGSNCSVRGTIVIYKENVNVDTNVFSSINPNLLPRDPDNGCVPVYPHSYLKVNTVFEVVKAAGGRTAYADKHPAYEIYNGPSGTGVDDLFTPEAAAAGAPNSIPLTEANDELKVQAILHQIDGLDHTGTQQVGVPNVFGMDFQTPNVAQKIAGYNPDGTPSAALAAAYDYVDGALGRMVTELQSQGILDSTMVIVTSKHGNSPLNPALRKAISAALYTQLIEGVQPGLTGQLTTDTIALIWLKDHSKAPDVLAALQSNADALGAETFYSGDSLTNAFNGELASFGNREPDIIVQPKLGVIYTTKTKKVEHGGFQEDDTHVPLMISEPGIEQHFFVGAVELKQLAPTILKSLGLKAKDLQAVRLENTKHLPSVGLDD